MIRLHNGFEQVRLKLQDELDARKTQAERNRLGQFATPTALALDILTYAATLIPEGEKIRLLDPAVGTGSFFSAFQQVFSEKQNFGAVGFEIDPHYGEPASHLWGDSDFIIKLADFTTQDPDEQFNLVICNPPYVRHHHLQNEDKVRLQARTAQASGMKLSGLAGLYCHFLGLSYPWMADGGVAGWLIPSEFMDVNYGKAIKHYLLEKVTLLKIHRFCPDDVQFTDALVSSAVVWFKKEPPPKNHKVPFTFGGSLLEPQYSREVSSDELAHEAKWSRFPLADIRMKRSNPVISDFFDIRRGIATGDNDFFILDQKEIIAKNLPLIAFRPILPSPRYLTEYEVGADAGGLPLLDRKLFLLDTKLSEKRIREGYPALFAYLQEGRERGVHEGYLCSHRAPWYSQENRPSAPIVQAVSSLASLQQLGLFINQISNLEPLSSLVSLQDLSLGNNQIIDLEPLRSLASLHTLNLCYNQISELKSLSSLVSLQTLDLDYNQISDIDPLMALNKLNSLCLLQNPIKNLPQTIANLPMEIEWEYRLGIEPGFITFFGNPLESPPPEIVAQGKEAVKNYFSSLEKAASEGKELVRLQEVKVHLVGEGLAGKTSLLKQLQGLPFSVHESQTHGINVLSLTASQIKGLEAEGELHACRFHFWDFGGQEIMHASHQFFLTNRSIYILLLDSRTDNKTHYWLRHIEKYGADSPIIVVMNKIDENSSYNVQQKQINDRFPAIGNRFYRVSCKTGEGIDGVVQSLKKAVTGEHSIYGTPLSPDWIAVKEKLVEETQQQRYIGRDRYEALCQECGVTDQGS